MVKRLNHFMILLTVIAVLMTSAISTTVVLADDNGPSGEPTEPAATEPAATEPAAAEDQPVVEESVLTETVEEILGQIPEGTELVVVSEDGIEPLASQEAAQILIEGDPIWCPDGATPSDGANGCTNAHPTFASLITQLQGGAYSGNGVIWVAASYAGADNNPVIFDGDVLTTLGNLTFTGGWSGGNNTTVDPLTPSHLDVSLSIKNWTGDVTLNNLVINAGEVDTDTDAGLYVQTDGNISLTNVTSSDNPFGLGAGLDTCLFDGEACAGSGNVHVTDSVFDNNGHGMVDTHASGSGLGIDSGGTIALDNVQADGNEFAGAELYNFDLSGPGGISVNLSQFNNNGDNGIWAVSDGTIALTNTDATHNGFDGVDLLNYQGSGDVTVDGGDFSDNDDTGLYIASSGAVTLNNVTSNNSLYNDGADIDNSYGSGNVQVTSSVFNDNNWNGLFIVSAGDITLDDVDASNNSQVGAYLNALAGTGSIFIGTDPLNFSTFNGNGEWGLTAFADEGDITVTNVTVNGDGATYAYDTENGAWLKSFNGNIWVEDSTFTHNLGFGLLAVAGGNVDLVNVTVTLNGGNGVEVYSIYNFACFGDQDILINVDSGTYSENGDYGIYAAPGPLGTLTLANSPEFLLPNPNGLGDTFVEHLANPCPSEDPGEPGGDGKPSNVVEIPETGPSEPVVQDCENFSSTTLQLHTGTTVEVGCPFTGSSQLSETTQDGLPGRLPSGFTFGSAITIGLDSEGNPVPFMTEGGLLTITFIIPEELLGKRMSILYWDPTAKDGLGDWIELPLEQFGGAYFPLHPDDPDDGRMICSGFEQYGNMVSITVNFPGVFVLVGR